MSMYRWMVGHKITRALVVLVLLLSFPIALMMVVSSYLLNVSRSIVWFTVLYFKTNLEVRVFISTFLKLDVIRRFNDESYWVKKGDGNG